MSRALLSERAVRISGVVLLLLCGVVAIGVFAFRLYLPSTWVEGPFRQQFVETNTHLPRVVTVNDDGEFVLDNGAMVYVFGVTIPNEAEHRKEVVSWLRKKYEDREVLIESVIPGEARRVQILEKISMTGSTPTWEPFAVPADATVYIDIGSCLVLVFPEVFDDAQWMAEEVPESLRQSVRESFREATRKARASVEKR